MDLFNRNNYTVISGVNNNQNNLSKVDRRFRYEESKSEENEEYIFIAFLSDT